MYDELEISIEGNHSVASSPGSTLTDALAASVGDGGLTLEILEHGVYPIGDRRATIEISPKNARQLMAFISNHYGH